MNRILLLSILACLVAVGCSSPNPNPPQPRPNTGYVDFYTDGNLGLSWEVKRGTDSGAAMKTVFADFTPVEASVLRVAVPPGTQRFQLSFPNRLTEGPQEVSVPVLNGKVTPVHVTLSPTGTNAVVTTTSKYVPAGRLARKQTRSSTEETGVFQVGAAAEPARDYLPKEQMPYWTRKD